MKFLFFSVRMMTTRENHQYALQNFIEVKADRLVVIRLTFEDSFCSQQQTPETYKYIAVFLCLKPIEHSILGRLCWSHSCFNVTFQMWTLSKILFKNILPYHFPQPEDLNIMPRSDKSHFSWVLIFKYEEKI